jgi:hypothetical protein
MNGNKPEPKHKTGHTHQMEHPSPMTHEAAGGHIHHGETPSPMVHEDSVGHGPGIQGSHGHMLDDYRKRFIVSGYPWSL